MELPILRHGVTLLQGWSVTQNYKLGKHVLFDACGISVTTILSGVCFFAVFAKWSDDHIVIEMYVTFFFLNSNAYFMGHQTL